MNVNMKTFEEKCVGRQIFFKPMLYDFFHFYLLFLVVKEFKIQKSVI